MEWQWCAFGTSTLQMFHRIFQGSTILQRTHQRHFFEDKSSTYVVVVRGSDAGETSGFGDGDCVRAGSDRGQETAAG